jgi:DNA repair exonuclease SbcCD ATPase subunit
LRAKGQRPKLEISLGDPNAFDVSVNGLQWREVSVSLEGDSASDENAYHQDTICLYLDIQALVPSTANEIEITNTSLSEPVILFHATICTTQKEATATTPAPQAVRPNSPISTLTDKLNNAVENLNNLKNNQKRIRRDHKSAVTSLRSEIDGLHTRLEAPDKGEERARRGNLALKYHIMQTEDKIRTLEDNIRRAEEAISDRQKDLISSRDKWESERSALEASRRSQHSTKSSLDKFLQQFHAEKMAINARKEKLTSREVKLKGEFEILETAGRKKDEKVDDRSRRRREARAQLIKERQASQAEQVALVEQMESHLAEIKERTARTHAERISIENMPAVLPPTSFGINVAPSPTLATTSPLPGVGPSIQNGSRQVSGSFEDALEAPPIEALLGLENDFVYK